MLKVLEHEADILPFSISETLNGNIFWSLNHRRNGIPSEVKFSLAVPVCININFRCKKNEHLGTKRFHRKHKRPMSCLKQCNPHVHQCRSILKGIITKSNTIVIISRLISITGHGECELAVRERDWAPYMFSWHGYVRICRCSVPRKAALWIRRTHAKVARASISKMRLT